MQEGKIIFRNCKDSEEVRLQLNPEAIKTSLKQLRQAKEKNEKLKKTLAAANDHIRNIIKAAWGEGCNCSVFIKFRAEEFLKASENFLKELEQ